MERGNAFVARDQIPTHFMVARLYTSPEFHQFIAACVGLPEVYQLADPLAGLCLNVLTEGRSHPWHFDTNEFAISMLTQAPSAAARSSTALGSAQRERRTSTTSRPCWRGGRAPGAPTESAAG
jgi:hypothetical protein